MRERLVNASRMRQFLRIHARRAGSRVLRVLLDSGPAFTRSEAESRFLDLVRRAELPAPAVNVRVSGCEVDFMWRRARLVVEIDGFAWHAHRDAFERDRRRDANLIAEGITVMRVTWRQLMDEPFAVVARVARVLATAAGSSAPSR
jgi:very-short-patch-repair endonuclease